MPLKPVKQIFSISASSIPLRHAFYFAPALPGLTRKSWRVLGCFPGRQGFCNICNKSWVSGTRQRGLYRNLSCKTGFYFVPPKIHTVRRASFLLGWTSRLLWRTTSGHDLQLTGDYLCGQTVRCRSANQANSAFHPSVVDKWVLGCN